MITRTGIFALLAFAFSASTMAQYSQPVRDVENAGHFPFSATAQHTMPAVTEGSRYGLALATVPAGKRVVLEYVGIACQTYGTDSISDFRIQIPRVIDGSNNTIPVPLAVSRQGDPAGGQKWIGGGPVKLYADHSTAFSINYGFSRTNLADIAKCQIYVFGHTIGAP